MYAVIDEILLDHFPLYTSTKEAAGGTITIKMTCPNANYDNLMAAPALCEQFKQNCKDATTKYLELDPSCISSVSLSKGSVVVQIEITPRPGVDAAELQQEAESSDMSMSVQAHLLASLPKKEMNKILSSGKFITVDKPVVVPPPGVGLGRHRVALSEQFFISPELDFLC